MSKNIKSFIFFFIFLATFVALSGILVTSRKNKRYSNPKYNVQVLIQTGPEKEALKSMYLAELLGLSVDNQTNIFKFDLEEAKRKLLSSPLIEKATVQRYLPNAIYVDYKVRKPLAWLYDLTNFAIDKNGYIFPISPFFPPKILPEIYLGDKSIIHSKDFLKGPLKSEKIDLAIEIYNVLGKLQGFSFTVKRIDVSNAFLQSFGKKEIVLELEHELRIPFKDREISYAFPRIIRLCVKDYESQLSNYFSLNESMMADYRRQLVITDNTPSNIRFAKKVIDMRIHKLAFIDE